MQFEPLESRQLRSATVESSTSEVAYEEQTAAESSITTAVYQAWMTCLKSCADAKAQVQGELARFR